MATAGVSERRKGLLATMMKEVIYEAAVAVLTEHGLSGVTMDRVAEKAGVAKGSLYNYFPNKQALLEFVHDRTIEPMMHASAEIVVSDLPAIEKLQADFRLWFESIEQQRGLFTLLFMDYGIRELLKTVEETGRVYAVGQMAQVIRQGIEEGVFREVNAEKVANFLFGIARETCERQLATDADWPINQLVDEVIDFVLHGLAVAE